MSCTAPADAGARSRRNARPIPPRSPGRAGCTRYWSTTSGCPARNREDDRGCARSADQTQSAAAPGHRPPVRARRNSRAGRWCGTAAGAGSPHARAGRPAGTWPADHPG
ncbi:hypothetical protein G6F59_018352 [Rhizopus arrhizus]|nr:hypothetical protein G6F59_018352 [Rhizopus arrhizus]